MLRVSNILLTKGFIADLHKLSKSFGNDKPGVLVRLELDLWKALLEVATGQDTLYHALGRFFERIPQNDLLSLTADERGFYSTGT